MSASIHINGTGSSIIDTVFVCRSTGVMPKKWLVVSADGVAQLVLEDLQNLRAGNVNPTQGDTRCIAYGHLVRLAIWSLRRTWNKNETITKRIAKVEEWLQDFGGWPEVENICGTPAPRIWMHRCLLSVREPKNMEPNMPKFPFESPPKKSKGPRPLC